jgi:hypothetical protein
VARTTSLPSWVSAASPNAMVRPRRMTDVRTAAGPAVPGRRKKPDTTTGSGNGMSSASARVQVASMYPPFTAPAVPFHRPVSSVEKAPSDPAATTRLSSSNAKSPIYGRVRISWPSSVTRIVCSNCAVRLRSLVTAVHPSGQMS